jgi:hypothetical protein
MRYFVHIKTRQIYTLLYIAEECTNGREKIPYAVYRSKESDYGVVYVRELNEFYDKFFEI